MRCVGVDGESGDVGRLAELLERVVNLDAIVDAIGKPYFRDDAVVIYNADCRDILPRMPKVDLVLTDPPYGIDGPMSGMQRWRGKSEYYSGAFEDTATYLRTIIVPLIVELITSTPAVILTPGNRHFSLYPQPKSFGVFYQPAAVAVQTFGHLDAQPIFYYGKNPRNERMGVPLSWVVTEHPEEFGHPCTKPIRAWKRLVTSVSLPGQTILDPFMGSGTTLRAAKDLGRLAVGIEIEEKYCAIAAKRMAQGVLL